MENTKSLLEMLRQLYLVILWDIRKIARYRFFLLMRFSWFIIQVSIFAVLISSLVAVRRGFTEFNYYQFYLFGVYTSILFSIALFRGYEIAEEFEEGIIEYQLSLPIKRKILAIGRSIGGGIASFIYTLPMFAFVVFMLGVYNVAAILISMFGALLFSIGVVGLAASIVLFAKSGDVTDILFGIIDALLLRLSTIFYPAVVLSVFQPYYYAAIVNPLSHITDLIRVFFFFEDFRYITISDPLSMAMYILGFSIGLSSLTILLIEKKVEGGGWK